MAKVGRCVHRTSSAALGSGPRTNRTCGASLRREEGNFAAVHALCLGRVEATNDVSFALPLKDREVGFGVVPVALVLALGNGGVPFARRCQAAGHWISVLVDALLLARSVVPLTHGKSAAFVEARHTAARRAALKPDCVPVAAEVLVAIALREMFGEALGSASRLGLEAPRSSALLEAAARRDARTFNSAGTRAAGNTGANVDGASQSGVPLTREPVAAGRLICKPLAAVTAKIGGIVPAAIFVVARVGSEVPLATGFAAAARQWAEVTVGQRGAHRLRRHLIAKWGAFCQVKAPGAEWISVAAIDALGIAA